MVNSLSETKELLRTELTPSWEGLTARYSPKPVWQPDEQFVAAFAEIGEEVRRSWEERDLDCVDEMVRSWAHYMARLYEGTVTKAMLHPSGGASPALNFFNLDSIAVVRCPDCRAKRRKKVAD